MAIKVKHQNPKPTDFGPNDLVINVREGSIFYKSEKSIFKLQGDDLNTTTDLISFNSNISAQKGFFKAPGIGDMVLGSQENNAFEVGIKTVEIGGHLLPSSSNSPKYDLGSAASPWRDLYLSPSSLRFIKTSKGVGASKIGTTFKISKYEFETMGEEAETLTQENVTDLKAGKSISGSGELNVEGITVEGPATFAIGITLTGGITGSINGGSF